MDAAGTTSPLGRRAWMVASVVVVLLVVAAAVGSAWRKPIEQGFDEVAHVSYAAALQHAPAWPDLEALRMLDPRSFAFTVEPNYLNHPPLYYGLIAALGPPIVGRPEALWPLRLINVAIAAAGLAALLLLARRLDLGRLEFYGFAAFVAATPVLAPLAGSVNNDNLGFTGGALALLGLYLYLAAPRRRYLLLACAGLLVAAAAKLTALLLVGGTLTMALLLTATRRRARWSDYAIVAAGLLLAALPYLVLILQYGSPTPNTAAQQALLTTGAQAAGWADQPRLSPAAYALFFLKSFGEGWMPSLQPRSDLQMALLALPAMVVVLALGGTVAALRAMLNRTAGPAELMVVAGMAAAAATLTIHIVFSYQRHLQTGWMMDAYPRYYLPLLAIVPIAALGLAARIQALRLRMVVVGFLIVAPIVFELFGAPLG